MKKITGKPGFFGSGMIYYDEKGNIVGKTVKGLFGGTAVHFDADGNVAGKSAPGLFGSRHTEAKDGKDK